MACLWFQTRTTRAGWTKKYPLNWKLSMRPHRAKVMDPHINLDPTPRPFLEMLFRLFRLAPPAPSTKTSLTSSPPHISFLDTFLLKGKKKKHPALNYVGAFRATFGHVRTDFPSSLQLYPLRRGVNEWMYIYVYICIVHTYIRRSGGREPKKKGYQKTV